MRIMTWNVNGIKTLVQYNPWNTLKTYEAILNALDADIICFQETKITKKQIERSMAILPSYDSFFSSYARKPEKGYSGTCIFTKKAVTVPIAAEEGLSGHLPRYNGAERETPLPGALTLDDISLSPQDLKLLDMEGRTTIVDIGLFVLVNLYCPNETNEERLDFKLAFNAMLEARILSFIRNGREVIVLGDLNIAARSIDHCDPAKRSQDSPYGSFENHPARKWFNEFIGENGSMVDLARHFHPDKKSMFTHWETRINARETNYGSRIDYILATPGLLPWIKTCNIQPHILGSDHCPVVVDFHESIPAPSGESLLLRDFINPASRRASNGKLLDVDPPRLAAKFYPEFGKEQRLLSNFFGKAAIREASTPIPADSATENPTPPTQGSQPDPHQPKGVITMPQRPTITANSVERRSKNSTADSTSALAIDLTTSDSDDNKIILVGTSKSKAEKLSSPRVNAKRSRNGVAPTKAILSKRKGSNQQNIQSFLSKSTIIPLESPKKADSPSLEKDTLAEGPSLTSSSFVLSSSPTSNPDTTEHLGKRKRSPSVDSEITELQLEKKRPAAAWSSIFSSKVPPLCSGHGEPCKQWTVNKSGKNKGRVFWLCNRPVGEGYDDGKSRAETNPAFRCNYFKWESDIKRAHSSKV